MDSKTSIWLNEALPKFELLGKHVAFIIENILQQNKIDYLSVSYRTKTKEGIVEKIERKSYKKLESDMTDISGVRVILYLDSDIPKVCSLISDVFKVDVDNSTNNDQRLSSDRIGYRSMHFVCEIGNEREHLREYQYITNLKFEIQVRTMLQHAWAELTHDRNYKLGKNLPMHIQRKINLFSAVLEVADQGFTEIVKMIDDYTDSFKEQNYEEILDREIDSISLYEFVQKFDEENGVDFKPVSNWGGSITDQLLKELDHMGINTLKDLSAIIPDNYKENLESSSIRPNIYSFVRNILTIKDYQRLRTAPGLNWRMAESDDFSKIEKLEKFYSHYLSPEQITHMLSMFTWTPEDEEVD
ncbi:GTP pyrophosphokinase [Erwinia sp. E602]|uniref:GTP pyrophosphokinase n=1 Tax=Erwinia sp. E602 TaxID=2675378 RepID=UPI001BAC45B8|nr:GTP pyrophosphokinase [Erwinia sp. E602]QUG75849.1 GTP pyrophosphokinase [Erwinia sp. E602]